MLANLIVVVVGGYCLYQMYSGITGGVVHAFGGQASAAGGPAYFAEHPLIFLFYFAIYTLIGVGCCTALVRTIRKAKGTHEN